MFRFASPYVLILLATIPITIWYRIRRMHRPALASSGTGAVEDLPKSAVIKLQGLMPVLFYIALALMITALARPQWGTRQMEVSDSGINIILAVDLSESMAALDFKHQGEIINRLEAVKRVVQEFIGNRNGDRIGMVVFGSQAYTQLPLTRDYNTIVTMLERLKIGAAGRATAIGDAMGISLKRLQDIESRSNIIILLTDGRSNSGEFEPLAAAAIAKEKGVKVYTIGVGGKGRAPFPVTDAIFGQRYVYQKVDMDERTLRAIADETEGLYFRAQDMEGLKKIYDTIDALEKTEVKTKTFAEYNDLYRYLLLPGLALLGIWIILQNTRFLKVP
ncbi:MAG: VWA domain-containing protein [Desulfobacteraceae bacterium]|jgi:Ca-activated chloride channel family protein